MLQRENELSLAGSYSLVCYFLIIFIRLPITDHFIRRNNRFNLISNAAEFLEIDVWKIVASANEKEHASTSPINHFGNILKLIDNCYMVVIQTTCGSLVTNAHKGFMDKIKLTTQTPGYYCATFPISVDGQEEEHNQKETH